MKHIYRLFFLLCTSILFFSCTQKEKQVDEQTDQQGRVQKFPIYHEFKLDKSGKIIPWYSEDLGISYDHIIGLVWNFWDTMRIDSNGVKYYMNHQVWQENHNDPRGIGGDQLAMALSSWKLLYAYSGNNRVLENMSYIADYYITHSLSPEDAKWPNLPYSYNTSIYSGIYDGDMVLGKDYLQPDKAGSFSYQLIDLYKITGDQKYLDVAIKIANTLASKVKAGDNNNSPFPFKVNAITGELGKLKNHKDTGGAGMLSSYTTNWTGTLITFEELIKMGYDENGNYKKAHDIILDWMVNYPLKTGKWGPFFEDVLGWSDTQTNAVTFAMYIMNRPTIFPDWKEKARAILDHAWEKFGNDKWKDIGVITINEQTAYKVPGNSHSSRQASMELLYSELTGDTTQIENAIRILNWATYSVNVDGRNRYPFDEVWLTDGYGDFVKHYLRSMAAYPDLVPNENHILRSSSIITTAVYQDEVIRYSTYDTEAQERIRMPQKPLQVLVNDTEIKEGSDSEGWVWTPLNKGGFVDITHKSGKKVTIKI